MSRYGPLNSSEDNCIDNDLTAGMRMRVAKWTSMLAAHVTVQLSIVMRVQRLVHAHGKHSTLYSVADAGRISKTCFTTNTECSTTAADTVSAMLQQKEYCHCALQECRSHTVWSNAHGSGGGLRRVQV